MVIILCVLCQAPLLYYSEVPENTAIVQALHDGWRTFDRIVGRESGASFTRTSKLEAAHVVILNKRCRRPGTAAAMKEDGGSCAAVTRHWPTLGAARIEIFRPEFMRASPSQREHIIAHELGHYYFSLDDEYPGPDTKCIMGDFFRFSWPDRFCDKCRKRMK